MLTLSKAQFAAFQDHGRVSFIEQRTTRLRTRFPEQTATMDPPELQQWVEGEVERAGRFGIRSKEGVDRFVELGIRYGSLRGAPPFEMHAKLPWAARVLANPALDGDAKMELIFTALEDAD